MLYFGSKKGAQLTLLERSGNDFDQCALLVALLRAAGYSASYQFGWMEIPYDSPDHNDLHHWLEIDLTDTSYYGLEDYFYGLLGARGYPFRVNYENGVEFHRIWVKAAIGGTNYYLDPAFKVSEPIVGLTNLPSAMGLDTNALLSAVSSGSTSTANYVQNLNEANLRNRLRHCTTNLLAYLQTNCPNASVEQVIGGWQIVSSANAPLSQSLLFPITNTAASRRW